MSLKLSQPTLAAITLAAVILNTGYTIKNDIDSQANSQNTLIKAWRDYQARISELTPLSATINATIPPADVGNSQYHIQSQLKLPDGLRLTDAPIQINPLTPHTYNNRPIGINKYAIDTLTLSATDVATAYQSIPILASRPDIRFNRASITADKTGTGATLTLTNFALLVRSDNEIAN